jgi:hypothetical protein
LGLLVAGAALEFLGALQQDGGVFFLLADGGQVINMVIIFKGAIEYRSGADGFLLQGL